MNSLTRLVVSSALALPALSALASTAVVDTFEAGVTQTGGTTSGFSHTSDPGINNQLPNPDNARYLSWTTEPGSAVVIENQSVPGSLLVTHAGGNSYSGWNVLYQFSSPIDLTGFTAGEVLGSGQGTGTAGFSLRDADGDRLVGSLLLTGSPFGNLVFSFASMICDGLGNGVCDLTNIEAIKFMADGFDGRAYTHLVNEIRLTSSPVVSVPEPQTYLMFALGLGALVGVARARRSKA